MEPITLCGLVIVIFGLWVEFEPAVKAVVRLIGNSRIYKGAFSQSSGHVPSHAGRVPICFAKAHS
jgi:hypothetical protein